MGFCAISFAIATTSICWCRSRKTRHACADISPSESRLPARAAASRAESTSLPNWLSYFIDRMSSRLGLNKSLSGHRASTTSHPDTGTGSLSRFERSTARISSSPSFTFPIGPLPLRVDWLVPFQPSNGVAGRPSEGAR